MAGETVRSEAICLDIRPWSRTSHIVSWLTPHGKVSTVVKGAVRPKSAFLGQYDLNYTCEILYYSRAKGELHALRDCVPLERRDELRGDYRALALAGYFRRLVGEHAPSGDDCESWFALLEASLSSLNPVPASLVRFELKVLSLAGLSPDFSGYDRTCAFSEFSVESGSFGSLDGRLLRISREVADYLCHPDRPVDDLQIPLDAARVIGVFYAFHVENVSDVRRSVLALISNNQGR